MQRSERVFTEVSTLYQVAETTMGKWMWHNHVQWVADRAKRLAEKYDGNKEIAYCAALLHDLADCKFERNYKDFDSWSWENGNNILKEAGFRHQERRTILDVTSTHACHPGHLPTTLEGKVLATADGMWHLQTSFFPLICYMNRPENHSYEEWQKWFTGKITRDFHTKIFFKDEKEETKADYEALIRVFSNTSLD